MAENIPQWARDIITRNAITQEAIADQIKSYNENLPKFVEALNSNFAVHNTKTDTLCASVEACNREAKEFRTEMWTKMWSLLEKVVIITVGVLAGTFGGIEVWKIIVGG